MNEDPRGARRSGRPSLRPRRRCTPGTRGIDLDAVPRCDRALSTTLVAEALETGRVARRTRATASTRRKLRGAAKRPVAE